MPTGTKATKGAKKLSRGKKLSEVKPLCYEYYMNVKGIKQGPYK